MSSDRDFLKYNRGNKMKYSHDYNKLKVDNYTTIRRYPKGKVGDITLEIYPSGQHKAKIKKIKRKTLDELPLSLLIADTSPLCGNRIQVYKLFQSFYKKEIYFTQEKFYLYYLEKEMEK